MTRFAVVPHRQLYVNGSFHVRVAKNVPRFDPGAEALEHLQREGYVVVSVANSSEVAHARELLWRFLESTGEGVTRHDASTWIANGPNNYGIFWGHGSGQSRLLWHIRTLPRLLQMFELVHGTPDLITSFEGFSMFPPERVEAQWRLGEAWFHTDQNAASRPGLQTVQSFTSLYDQDASTGGFVVVPKSWLYHDTVTERIYRAAPRTPPTQQFLMVPADDEVLSRPHRPRLIKVRAGDAILWDSRTVHCSTPPLRNRRTPKATPEAEASAKGSSDRAASNEPVEAPARVVVYACLAPRSRATDEVLLQRQRALFTQQTCTHWPFEMACLDTPSAVGQRASDPLRYASSRVKHLVGYTDTQILGWLHGKGADVSAGAPIGPFDTPAPVRVVAKGAEGEALWERNACWAACPWIRRAARGRLQFRNALPSSVRKCRFRCAPVGERLYARAL